MNEDIKYAWKKLKQNKLKEIEGLIGKTNVEIQQNTSN